MLTARQGKDRGGPAMAPAQMCATVCPRRPSGGVAQKFCLFSTGEFKSSTGQEIYAKTPAV